MCSAVSCTFNSTQEIKNLLITIFETYLSSTKPVEISKVTKGRNFQVCPDRKLVKTFFPVDL